MFLADDFYTVSPGNFKLYGCWTDKVTKHDSSSFYNWEQDNLPLYDLEERTYFLWEKLGFPTSAIPGISLVVSADATDEAIGCNKNIFRTLEEAINILPNVINFPVIIEVANFGDCGELVLDNLKFGNNGSIEIINRNFAKNDYSFSAEFNTTGSFSQYSPLFLFPPYFFRTNLTEGSQVGITVNLPNSVSAIIPIGIAYKPDGVYPETQYNKKIIFDKHFKDTSCISISSTVFSSFDLETLEVDGRLSNNLNTYLSFAKTSTDYTMAGLGIENYTITGVNFLIKPYDYDAEYFDQVITKDIAIQHPFDLNLKSISYGDMLADLVTDPINTVSKIPGLNGLFFGNKLNKIKVNNCNGPIYIRNFFVDGSGAFRSDNLHGVEVNNTSNLFLENIVSVRSRKSGFYFNNSNVKILRSCVASRIYDFDENNLRVTQDYSSTINNIEFDTSNGYLKRDDSAGLFANNSIITFSSTDDHEYPLMREAVNYEVEPLIPSTYIIEFTKSSNGIVLNNSTLIGGKSQEAFKDTKFRSAFQTFIDCADNTNTALTANNSKVSLNGYFRVINNFKGIELEHSTLEVDKFACLNSQKTGLTASHSKILYNKNNNKHHENGNRLEYNGYTPVFYFDQNGQHLNIKNSTIIPFEASGMDKSYEQTYFSTSRGITDTQLSSVQPAIEISDNSYANFISFFSRKIDGSIFSLTNILRPVIGSQLKIYNNSTVELRGTKHFANRIIGPIEYINSKNLNAISVENNSKLFINGPTVVSQFAIDLFANNNSTIQISPRTNLDGGLDISSIDLTDSRNHTSVELHSVRACIVADNNSNIIMKDLGSYADSYTRGFPSESINSLDLTWSEPSRALYTSAGSIQFYPNPIESITSQNYANMTGAEDPLNPNNWDYTARLGFSATDNQLGNYYHLDPYATSPLDFSAVTYGGVCVKAVNDSNVTVQNVNFPCGFWNPSAPYYDGAIEFTEGGACNKLFIWNISDSSKLKASFVSVSASYPSSVGYHGPFGYWGSGTNGTIAISGAPSSTPNTSSLSILDLYGANPSGTPYSFSSHQNIGPFRLFFSVNQMVNSLSSNDLDIYYNRQLYSQGYQSSSTLNCHPETSAMYLKCLRVNELGQLAPSGYYYNNEIMISPNTVRAWLDESAASLFANARHCSANISNISTPVSIYFPYVSKRYGEVDDALGLGSFSIFDISRLM